MLTYLCRYLSPFLPSLPLLLSYLLPVTPSLPPALLSLPFMFLSVASPLFVASLSVPPVHLRVAPPPLPPVFQSVITCVPLASPPHKQPQL